MYRQITSHESRSHRAVWTGSHDPSAEHRLISSVRVVVFCSCRSDSVRWSRRGTCWRRAMKNCSTGNRPVTCSPVSQVYDNPPTTTDTWVYSPDYQRCSARCPQFTSAFVDDVYTSLVVSLFTFVCLQRLRCVSATEMADSGAAVEVTDRPARDGAEGRPRRQKWNPRQDQGWKRFLSCFSLLNEADLHPDLIISNWNIKNE